MLTGRRPVDGSASNIKSFECSYLDWQIYQKTVTGLKNDYMLLVIKTCSFGQPEPKVQLGQAWRIEFSYINIRES